MASVQRRHRNFFFFYVSNVLGENSLNVGYRTSKFVTQTLSASKQGAEVKIPFGPVNKCVIVERRDSKEEEIRKEFKFYNVKNQGKLMKNVPLNNLEISLSDFSRKITQMYVEDQKELMSLYLTLINKSSDFIYHHEEKHDPDGFLLDGTGVTSKDIDCNGGSLEDYREFVRFAREGAIMVTSIEDSLKEITSLPSNKRKSSSSIPQKPVKLSKLQMIQKNEKVEIEDKDGLEVELKNSMVGCCKIPLDNISVCKEMEVRVSPYKVRGIVNSMRNRYDPSKSVLVVCPVEPVADINDLAKDPGNKKYYVVQKVHCLKAFQEFDKTGEFINMAGHQSRSVLCYVLNNNKPEVMLYANARENFIDGQFARKTHPQDILHYFDILVKKDTSVKALKVVNRMAKLLCLGVEESVALERMCKWTRGGFDKLMQVVHAYEKFKTLDLKKSGHQQRLERGEKLTIPNWVLKLLGRCPEDYFVLNYVGVLDSVISLKQLVENYKEKLEVEKVYKVLGMVAGYDDVKSLLDRYPGKFEFEKMKVFKGAVMTQKIKNLKAHQIEKYYEQVVDSETAVGEVDVPISFIAVESTADTFGGDIIDKSDMIVYIMSQNQADIVAQIVKSILGCDEKRFHASLLVFSSEADYFEAICYLRSQQAVTSLVRGFKLFPLLFKVSPVTTHEISTNVKYALLFGKLWVSKSPLCTLYTDIEDLNRVIDTVCPPKSLTSLICDEGQSLIKIHDQKCDKNVIYYGFKNDLGRFKKMLESDKTPVSVKSELLESDSMPSTSPMKFPSLSLNDSGVGIYDKAGSSSKSLTM